MSSSVHVQPIKKKFNPFVGVFENFVKKYEMITLTMSLQIAENSPVKKKGRKQN